MLQKNIFLDVCDAYTSLLLTELKQTLFFAKALDEFSSFLRPGIDYNIISARASECVSSNIKDIFVYENEIKRREFSTSTFFRQKLFSYDDISKMIRQNKNICVYQPYPWTDDLRSIGVNLIANSYSLYLLIDNKISMFSNINDYGSSFLKKNIKNRQEKFLTEFLTLNEFSRINNGKVYSSRRSDGGSGVVYSDENICPKDIFDRDIGPIFRCEKYMDRMIPMTQSLFVFEDSIIKLKPGIQIILKSNNGNMSYFGTDYCVEEHVSEEILKKITKITHDVGLMAKSLNYKGAMGCDYLLDIETSEVYLIEINPRFQSSTFIFSNITYDDAKKIREIDVLLNPYLLHLACFKFKSPHKFLEKEKSAENFVDLPIGNIPKAILRLKKNHRFIAAPDSAPIKRFIPSLDVIIEDNAPYENILIYGGVIENPRMPQKLKGILSAV